MLALAHPIVRMQSLHDWERLFHHDCFACSSVNFLYSCSIWLLNAYSALRRAFDLQLITLCSVFFFWPGSPGTWPGGAWFPWWAAPCLWLVFCWWVIYCPTCMSYVSFVSSHLQKRALPQFAVHVRFFNNRHTGLNHLTGSHRPKGSLEKKLSHIIPYSAIVLKFSEDEEERARPFYWFRQSRAHCDLGYLANLMIACMCGKRAGGTGRLDPYIAIANENRAALGAWPTVSFVTLVLMHWF